MVPYLRAANVKDGFLDLRDIKEMNFTPGEQQVFSLRPGDVLVSEGAGSLAAVGASAVWDGSIEGVICYQNTLLRLRPLPSVTSPRFLAWWARHAYASGLFASVGIGVNIYHLSADRVRSLQVHFPSIAAQERVADFLGRETARFEDVVAAKRRMLGLVRMRRRAFVEALIMREGHPITRVKSVVHRITSGPRGWAGYVSDRGDPFLRITNLSRESMDLSVEGMLRVQPPDGGEAGRTRVDEGDVLVSITADIGSVGVVGRELAGGYVSQHLALLRPDRTLVDPRWLALALFTSLGQAQLDSARYGGTKTQLSLDDVAEVRVPMPLLDEQRRALARWAEMESASDRLTAALERQIAVFLERRQVLITAAVTKQLSVRTSAA